ncbi:hypothetical protein QYE76_055425 [Lolium multiflorum]|uniref:Uncharacterized protein n=1 Tax=Lolium multiflorum TaxID=4521 RepID=A0AAD8T106_LOLMU|nr:hypothetical protein QYE76_055425 [Lolium multiflorum]
MASAAAEKGKSPAGVAELAAASAAREWSTWAMKKAKVVAHYGFIPLVVLVGMRLMCISCYSDGLTALSYGATLLPCSYGHTAHRTGCKPADRPSEYATRVVFPGLTGSLQASQANPSPAQPPVPVPTLTH